MIYIYLILGVIFDSEDEETELAFKHAVIRENIANFNKFNLVPIIKNIDITNTYEAEEAGKSQKMFIFSFNRIIIQLIYPEKKSILRKSSVIFHFSKLFYAILIKV